MFRHYNEFTNITKEVIVMTWANIILGIVKLIKGLVDTFAK
ncbi:alpha-1/alpha-2 family phenol-soluble modulin [Staphylococcus coagulans]|nr:alpha-1/alpha-2 family phenol-soluble modulin [Staphylococcus coagulans]MBA8761365.1 alpha-1/alpha-2 family phenol-soluble modulin [Staphylococcus coagulans]MBA8767939.1 alpha-1/alpha-2 family phenol-soluble modulin [Staphylococcus coagulans]